MVKALNPPLKRKSKQPRIIMGSIARRASIRVPEKMLEEVNGVLEQDGKSSHQKGKWISQAILDLYNEEDYLELVKEEWLDRKNNIPLQITLTKAAEDILEKIVDELKEEGSARKDHLSATIRVAITAALIRSGVL